MERVLPPVSPMKSQPSARPSFDDDHDMQPLFERNPPNNKNMGFGGGNGTPPPYYSSSPDEQPPKKKRKWAIIFWTLFFLLLAGSGTTAVVGYFYWQNVYHKLPDVSELKNVQMQVPLRIYTSDMKLMAEFGEKKRVPLNYDQIPPKMIQAILASEDDRFFEHPGVDYHGILRAFYELIKTGHKSQGGSTITMQVARNFYLSPEKSFQRKINEIVLSFKIENELTKQEILALYLNKIFLGHRSYGVAAAAQTYFGKPLDQLEVGDLAVLAGLPKAPSTLNPVTNVEASKNRRDYVLRRMAELGYISELEKTNAQAKPVIASIHNSVPEANGDYIAEMVRQWALDKYGDTILEQGVNIITTIRSDLQTQAQKAIDHGVISYERRHGYRGPIKVLDAEAMRAFPQSVSDVVVPDGLQLAVVTQAYQERTKSAQLKLADGHLITLDAKALDWAKNFREPGRRAVLQTGDLVYVEAQLGDSYALAQQPKIQSALVSLDAKTGALLALSGGYDFARNQFNHAVQARRQPGSSFKPFLYAAALDKGYTPATIINDAPITQYDEFNEDYWKPENSTGKFGGPTRMRMALTASLNLVSIRILQDIGIDYFLTYLRQLGIENKEMSSVRNLSLSLGTASMTLLDHTGNYTMFANGGYRLQPYFVSRVEDARGNPLYETPITQFCDQDCPNGTAKRVIKATTHYLITSMMQDVVRAGTAKGAMVLKRNDLAGKTGTTNDIKDTWFMGFNPDVVTGVWMGFDQPTSMGRSESGGSSSLPIWVDYMRLALKDSPDVGFPKPVGIISKRIDAVTGELLPVGQSGGINEVFDENNLPVVSEPDPLRELQHELF
jgi:penicillin-binding protein 1A